MRLWFLGCYSFVDLREVGFALSLLLCGGGWGVWGLRGGVGVGGASLSVGVLGAFLLRGVGWDFSACWREGMGLITGNHINQRLVNSKPVEAFEMSFTKLSPLTKKC